MNFFVPNQVLACDAINWVNFNLGKLELELLIDTGASLSAIKYEILDLTSLILHKSELSINGIGGILKSEGFVYLPLKYEGFNFSHKFHVFKNLPCKAIGILGQDFIRRYRGVIDYSTDTLSLQTSQNTVILPMHYYQHILTIGPRCEVIKYLPTRVNYDCVIYPKEIQEGVFLASVVSRPKNGKIPIRLLNTTEKEVSLNLKDIEIDSLDNYDFCNFDVPDVSVERVKTLFSLLNLPSYLKKDELLSIEQICAKYSDIFHLPEDKLTVTNIYEQSIKLKDNATPVYRKQYRIPFAQKDELSKQIDKMIENGIIEKTSSEWSSPLLLVPKKEDKNGKRQWRVVIDYRQLNERIQDDKFPLPNITEILESLSGVFYFSHCDLSQSYYQCSLEQESRKYTAFTTSTGQYQMCRLPMGLKISPSTFSRLMTIAMSGLNYEKCIIYMDDLIIFGKNLIEHNKNLMSVFTRLRKVNLKINPLKCEFLKRQILYLGHVISAEGILPDPEKIRVVERYPTPTCADDVKRFVAFANYYRKFIHRFGEIVIPLNKLSRKNAKFEWTSECENAFDTLKKLLSKPPVLDYPDFSQNNEFILQTDSSGKAVGSVLCNNNGKPVAYASRSLNKAELNYATIEKELLAVVWSIKYFRPYLFGKKFVIRTDHKPLIYLFNMTNPSSRLTKFRLLLEEYDFRVEYVKGRDNVVADALSRIIITSDELKEMNKNVMCVITRAQARKKIIESADDDNTTSSDDRTDHPKIAEVLKKCCSDIELIILPDMTLRRVLNNQGQDIIISNNGNLCYCRSKNNIFASQSSLSVNSRDDLLKEMALLCKSLNIEEIVVVKTNKNRTFIEWLAKYIAKNINKDFPRICIIKDVQRIYTDEEKKIIMNDFHLLPSSGHVGIRRMVNNIKKYYYWPSLEKDVRCYVSKCDKCQKQKYTIIHKEPLSITTTASTSFQKLFLDIVGPIDRDDNGFCYILTLQCELSKYVEAFPLRTKTTTEVAKVFAENFILRYGIPKEIASDRGSEFTSKVMSEMCNILNIKQTIATSYHHQSIGALENTHKVLGAYLRIQTNNHSSSWSSWLPYWCFSYNTTVHTETKYTPYELVFGQLCRLPNNLSSTVEPLYNFDNYVSEFKYRMQKAQHDAKCNLILSKQKRKEQHDKSIKPIVYKPGDSLLLKNETGTKLDALYSGPYDVIIDLAPNVKINMDGKDVIVHKNRTKLYKE